MIIILTCNILFIIGSIAICAVSGKGISAVDDAFVKEKCGVEIFKDEHAYFS